MASVVENREVVSRHYLEQLQTTLESDGDDRLARALTECDTIRFGLDWVTCLGMTGLIAALVHFIYLGDNWSCAVVAIAAVLLVTINRSVDQLLLSYYNRRFYEAIPHDLRWCFRRTP
jgi:hypothetical protein